MKYIFCRYEIFSVYVNCGIWSPHLAHVPVQRCDGQGAGGGGGGGGGGLEVDRPLRGALPALGREHAAHSEPPDTLAENCYGFSQ